MLVLFVVSFVCLLVCLLACLLVCFGCNCNLYRYIELDKRFGLLMAFQHCRIGFTLYTSTLSISIQYSRISSRVDDTFDTICILLHLLIVSMLLHTIPRDPITF